MSEEFAIRVEQGLKLSRRIYYGKGITPPLVPDPDSSPENFLPTAITAYASITDPVAVDNPDVPSYQPYVHARCDPSALVPLQMLGIEMRVDSWLDTAFVTVTGRWRVHCVMPSKHFDCCIAVPMGEKVKNHFHRQTKPTNLLYLSFFLFHSINSIFKMHYIPDILFLGWISGRRH